MQLLTCVSYFKVSLKLFLIQFKLKLRHAYRRELHSSDQASKRKQENEGAVTRQESVGIK